MHSLFVKLHASCQRNSESEKQDTKGLCVMLSPGRVTRAARYKGADTGCWQAPSTLHCMLGTTLPLQW